MSESNNVKYLDIEIEYNEIKKKIHIPEQFDFNDLKEAFMNEFGEEENKNFIFYYNDEENLECHLNENTDEWEMDEAQKYGIKVKSEEKVEEEKVEEVKVEEIKTVKEKEKEMEQETPASVSESNSDENSEIQYRHPYLIFGLSLFISSNIIGIICSISFIFST